MSSRSGASVLVAGPTVAMILVRLMADQEYPGSGQEAKGERPEAI
jgi:hypothetical protein